MKRLQLYQQNSLSLEKTESQENVNLEKMDYYSIYSQPCEIVYLNNKRPDSTSIMQIDNFHHKNSNLNEYHKMLKKQKEDNVNLENVLTFKLDTRQKSMYFQNQYAGVFK